MDNFKVSIEARSKSAFVAAMELVFAGSWNDLGECLRKATAYSQEDSTLTLYWGDVPTRPDGAKPLPYPLDTTAAINFAWDWLQTVRPAEKEPDIDGTIRPEAWRVENSEALDRVICRVSKRWALYHK